MRADFGRVSQEKGRFASSLEKWNIFPNQYLAIANRCAELYDTICEALPKLEKKMVADNLATQNLAREKSNRRSEEHTSELQYLMRNSYAVFCFKKNNANIKIK